MLRNLWKNSIAFRRVVAVLIAGSAALAFYLLSHIPQSASLPNPDIDKLATAALNEHLRIYRPKIDPGDPLLSLEGAANVSAQVWVRHATLSGISAVLFGQLAPAGPASAVYAEGNDKGKHAAKDCRTMLTIRRPKDFNAPQTVDLWQDGSGTDNQMFRQLIVSSSETSLIEVSTNAPPDSQATCPRLLTLDKTPIQIPNGPVYLLAPANEPITLQFDAVDPRLPTWTSKHATFSGLSLGEKTLKAGTFDVISTDKPNSPLLHVVTRPGTDGFTLSDLKLGAEQVSLSVGQKTEQADAWSNGQRLVVFDLVKKIQDNPVLGYFLAAAVTGFGVWVKKTCFPPKRRTRKKAELRPKEQGQENRTHQ